MNSDLEELKIKMALRNRERLVQSGDRAIVVLMLLIICGCSTVYEGKYDYKKGWREGLVIKTAPRTASLPISGIDCRNSTQGERIAYVQFVFGAADGKFSHQHLEPRHAILPIPPMMEIADGDSIYLNILDCAQLLVPKHPRR